METQSRIFLWFRKRNQSSRTIVLGMKGVNYSLGPVADTATDNLRRNLNSECVVFENICWFWLLAEQTTRFKGKSDAFLSVCPYVINLPATQIFKWVFPSQWCEALGTLQQGEPRYEKTVGRSQQANHSCKCRAAHLEKHRHTRCVAVWQTASEHTNSTALQVWVRRAKLTMLLRVTFTMGPLLNW